ncbi:MAG: hypothetical protein LE180_06025 [Endomicrobium sp.]|nr:hypothetical protein [Endomicrobium sp.]
MHNVPFVFLGMGLLLFGWFGFNAGSALAASGLAAHAFMTTAISAAAGMLMWMRIIVKAFKTNQLLRTCVCSSELECKLRLS